MAFPSLQFPMLPVFPIAQTPNAYVEKNVISFLANIFDLHIPYVSSPLYASLLLLLALPLASSNIKMLVPDANHFRSPFIVLWLMAAANSSAVKGAPFVIVC